MPDPIDLKFAIGLPPEKAIEYFKSKGYTFSWRWEDVWREAHAKAFTVAKVLRMDVLQDIRAMVQKALDEGITFEQFRKELEPRLKAKGWWGYKFVTDSKGNIEKILEGSPRRLRTIYGTNLQTAYMAGRYKEFIDNVDNRPYWQYKSQLYGRYRRKDHIALHNKVFRYDDPFWDKFFPPNGWGCACYVRAWREKDIKRMGLNVESSEGKLRIEDRLLSKKTGELRPVTVYEDPESGIIVAPDPGWDYNPGKAAWFPDLDSYDYDIAKKWIEGGLTGPDFIAFYTGVIKGNFPVAVLSEDYKKLIGSETQVVLLSSPSLTKNIASHPELAISDYQQLPGIIENAQLIIEKEDERLIFIEKDKKLYFAVVKVTQNRNELFLTSFRLTNEKDAKREMHRGKVIRNTLFK